MMGGVSRHAAGATRCWCASTIAWGTARPPADTRTGNMASTHATLHMGRVGARSASTYTVRACHLCCLPRALLHTYSAGPPAGLQALCRASPQHPIVLWHIAGSASLPPYDGWCVYVLGQRAGAGTCRGGARDGTPSRGTHSRGARARKGPILSSRWQGSWQGFVGVAHVLAKL